MELSRARIDDDTAAIVESGDAYVRNFAPEIVGLRGTPDQFAALARCYRIVYSVTPATEDDPYAVTHSSGIYVFDRANAARLSIASPATTAPFPAPPPTSSAS
jgi:cytochrome oxidase Cu insertion factor (SCO1/SenC/PrrC family)